MADTQYEDLLRRILEEVVEAGVDALREWLIMFRARYRAALPPIVITESGCSYNVGPDADGVVDDQARIDYLRAHVNAVSEAIQRGVDFRSHHGAPV